MTTWNRQPLTLHFDSTVGVEAFPGLSSKFAFLDHLNQQRCWRVFFRSKAFVKYVHDVENRIVTNKVGKRQRTDGVIHAQFHDAINGFGLCHAFL